MVTHQLQVRCRPVKESSQIRDRRSTTEPPNQLARPMCMHCIQPFPSLKCFVVAICLLLTNVLRFVVRRTRVENWSSTLHIIRSWSGLKSRPQHQARSCQLFWSCYGYLFNYLRFCVAVVRAQLELFIVIRDARWNISVWNIFFKSWKFWNISRPHFWNF